MTIPESAPGPPPEPPAVGVLKADGNSEATYELIRRCGYNGVEAPDQSGCHTSVQHITQSKDNVLGTWVFDFGIHINEDNAVGTADVGNPVFTYTARSMSNGKQQFQVIYVGPTAAATGNVYLVAELRDELLQFADFSIEKVSR